jgi:hypothetical protein
MKKRIIVNVGEDVLDIELDATAFVKWENRAKAARIALPLLLSLFLAAEVQRT